ncbi:Calcium-binding EF-hand [Corchorus olitorius]|uniref:Calcium-binding EF-hand n=1 Tax=Corchorus olitorius TaxID=93759 RepID=A0A1R3HWY2_9ROSI|nr:Calcium-binding EF-hand [Corchorus olitorius]
MFLSANVPKGPHPSCRRNYYKGAAAPRWPLTEEELKAIFKHADGNNDKRLSKEELKKAFDYLGSRLPFWRAGKGLHQADVNQDGYVSDDELDDLVKYALEWLRHKHT